MEEIERPKISKENIKIMNLQELQENCEEQFKKIYDYLDKVAGKIHENIYSFEERVVGEFHGKPLYRKDVEVTANKTNQTFYIPHNVKDVDYIRVVEGTEIYSESRLFVPNNFYNTNEINCYCYADLNNVCINFRSNEFLNKTGIITIEYTKTTDEGKEN